MVAKKIYFSVFYGGRDNRSFCSIVDVRCNGGFLQESPLRYYQRHDFLCGGKQLKTVSKENYTL